MKAFTTAALSLVVGSSVAYGAVVAFSLKGESAIDISRGEHGDQIKKIETRFFEHFYVDTPKIYKVVTRSVHNTGVDGVDERTIIEAYAKKGESFGAKTWALKSAGGDFEIYNDHLLQVTESGCCDSPNLNHMINAETGKEVIVALNESTLEFTVPNSKLSSRYFAQVQDTKAPEKRGTKSYIGTLGYFEAGRVRGIARVYAALPEGWGSGMDELTPVLRAKDEKQRNTITLWSADGSNDAAKAYSDIGMKGKISFENKEETFSIVLEADRLSPSRSKVSSSLDLEVLNY